MAIATLLWLGGIAEIKSSDANEKKVVVCFFGVCRVVVRLHSPGSFRRFRKACRFIAAGTRRVRQFQGLGQRSAVEIEQKGNTIKNQKLTGGQKIVIRPVTACYFKLSKELE